jgi:hypothetical protein
MQRVASPGDLSPSQWDDYKESYEQPPPLQPARAPSVVRRTSCAHRMIHALVSGVLIADRLVLVRDATCVQRAKPALRQCPCGRRLSGRAPKIAGIEMCKRCEVRHYRGQSPILRSDSGDLAAVAPRAAARPRQPSPLPFSPPPPTPGAAHATRAV